MSQAAGAGEVTSRMLKNAVTAATVGTEHEGKFCPNYVVRSARKLHPEVFAPVKSLANEDRRVEWLTYKNINDWTDIVKRELIDLGVVYDSPGFISKLFLSWSELKSFANPVPFVAVSLFTNRWR